MPPISIHVAIERSLEQDLEIDAWLSSGSEKLS
jgi:hypothetical protein